MARCGMLSACTEGGSDSERVCDPGMAVEYWHPDEVHRGLSSGMWCSAAAVATGKGGDSDGFRKRGKRLRASSDVAGPFAHGSLRACRSVYE